MSKVHASIVCIIIFTLLRGADVTRCDQEHKTPLISAASTKKNTLIAHFIIRHLLERLNGEHDQEEYTRQESFVIDQLEVSTSGTAGCTSYFSF